MAGFADELMNMLRAGQAMGSGDPAGAAEHTAGVVPGWADYFRGAVAGAGENFARSLFGPAPDLLAKLLRGYAASVGQNPIPTVHQEPRPDVNLDWVREEEAKAAEAGRSGDVLAAAGHGLGILPGLVGTAFDAERENLALRGLGSVVGRLSTDPEVRRIHDTYGPQAAWDYAAERWLPNRGFLLKGLAETLTSPSSYIGFGIPRRLGASLATRAAKSEAREGLLRAGIREAEAAGQRVGSSTYRKLGNQEIKTAVYRGAQAALKPVELVDKVAQKTAPPVFWAGGGALLGIMAPQILGLGDEDQRRLEGKIGALYDLGTEADRRAFERVAEKIRAARTEEEKQHLLQGFAPWEIAAFNRIRDARRRYLMDPKNADLVDFLQRWTDEDDRGNTQYTVTDYLKELRQQHEREKARR